MSAPENLRVGGFIWMFRYVGRDYRKNWSKVEITGETSRSWLIGRGHDTKKISKADLKEGVVHSFLATEAEVDADCYLNAHGRRIAEAVQWLCSHESRPALKVAAKLRQIAELVGYADLGAP